jgi:TolA-binding protein
MAGKFVTLIISGILLFSISVPLCFADEFEELYRTKENICSLIETGKFSEAKAATDKMAIEYMGQEKLPEMLYWVAERFQRFDRFDDSKKICEQIINDYPDSPWSGKARLGNVRWDATSLIVSGKYADAKAVTDKMADDFAGSPDLTETLYWISGRFQAFDRFDDSKQIYEQIIRDYPESPWAKKARINKAMSEAMSLVVSGKYAEAKEVTDKMISDFARSSDLSPGANLPEMLYWISERYERSGRADEAKRDYQRLIDLYPNNPLAMKAKLGIPRADVIALVLAKNFNNAETALNKMTADFASHPDLPETLYWLAYRYQDIGRVEDANHLYQQITQTYANNIYASKAQTALSGQILADNIKQDTKSEIRDTNDEKSAVELYRVARGYEETNQLALAGQTYEKVIREYPGTIKANNAVLDIRRLAILEKMETGEVNEASILLDKFVADFKQHPYTCECLTRFAQTCYMKAAMLKAQGNAGRAKPEFETAIKTWKLIIDEFPPSISFTPHAWFFCGACYSQLGQNEEARQCYQRVADDWPDYGLAKEARLMADKGFKNVIKWDPNKN